MVRVRVGLDLLALELPPHVLDLLGAHLELGRVLAWLGSGLGLGLGLELGVGLRLGLGLGVGVGVGVGVGLG